MKKNARLAKVPRAAAVSVDPLKTALVIVDMQNDFADPKGKIYVGSMVQRSIPRIAFLLKRARESGMKILYTQSWYEKDDARFQTESRGRGRHGGGCMADTWGAQLIDTLQRRENEPVIRKASYDCFFRTNMEDVLDTLGYGRFLDKSVHSNRAHNDFSMIVTGTVSNICVEKAVIGLYHRGYEVIVPIDCISANTKYEQDWALRQFTTLYAAKLTKSDLITVGKQSQMPVVVSHRA